MIGKNISLRAIEPADIDLLYNWENDISVWHVSSTIVPFSRFVIEQYVMSSHNDIYTSKQLRLMIDTINQSVAKTIGSIDLFDFDPSHSRAGVAILIANDERRKGFASEALGMVIKYCFETLHLHQIYCNISTENDISLNLFKRHSFEIIGIKKEWIKKNNSWMDEYMLQLINKQN